MHSFSSGFKRTRRTGIAIIAAIGLTAGLSACSSDDGGQDMFAKGSQQKKVKVVTSTKVWSDVVDAVTDDEDVEITPIITGNAVDPHSFEPTAADMAKAKEADLIVVGGGGYDSWLYDHVKNPEKIIHALPLTSHDHEGHDQGAEAGAESEAAEEGHEGHTHGSLEGSEGNEHIWYDPMSVAKMATAIEEELREKKSSVDTKAADVEKRMNDLDKKIHALPPARVAQTHPIADHLLDHAAFEEVTPDGYRATTLSESEPTAADVAAMIDLINNNEIDLLIDAPQTGTEFSKRIRKAAEDKGIKVVDVYETPADGQNFFDMLDKLATDLGKATEGIAGGGGKPAHKMASKAAVPGTQRDADHGNTESVEPSASTDEH